jgi:hypothetical protein
MAVSVCYDLGDRDCIGRISETVFAVGWSSSYLVAARHPYGDKSRIEFFIWLAGSTVRSLIHP